MTITVHNARKPIPKGCTPVYVGRKTTYRPEFGADFSILGNPYTLRKHGTRAEAIALYRQWLPLRLNADTPQTRALEALANRIRAGESLLLICWCAPLACHADVITEELERLTQETSV
ncbi:DUF4326 domain-containing protein [Deinococcus sp. QL22]|uniref:DUF4326 domain-containing protein n=1 Tax=Deinococcus sp. QL22 TaxID=2939437 RepID=UPI0020170EED|nr:DUF4326 domain-containing protein [Deinococcus sp. QL22]UQN04903.1 DUF4326 domain-containing protein [Deinococcus sp. QL22]